MQIHTRLSVSLAVALAIAACGGGGGGSTPAPTGPGSGNSGITPGSIGAIITLTASGLSLQTVRIERTQRVRFVNNDTVPHQIQTNPHLLHTECTANNVIILNPGQQVDTADFNEIKTCGYHDHLNPESAKFHGVIRVGTDDEYKGPIYSRGW
jgi:hypothetical protein